MFDEHLLSGRGSSLHSVNDDYIRSCLDRQLDIVAHAGGTKLDVNRKLPVSDFSELGYLDGEVVRTHPVRMAAGRPLINPLGQGSHLGDALADLEPQ
jgi:hypothetical protein